MAETTTNPKENAAAGNSELRPAQAGAAFRQAQDPLLVGLVIAVGMLGGLLLPPLGQANRRRWPAPPSRRRADGKAKKAAAPRHGRRRRVARAGGSGPRRVLRHAFQSTSNTTLRIDFHLFGTVKAESQKEFSKLMEENKHRFREQVLVTVRAADITELTDAGLGLMKRKILDRANHTLGKPLLETVVVSDFSFIEQ